MRKSFLKSEMPLVTAMICCKTPEECIDKIKLSIAEGAEAIGVQLECLGREYRTEKNLKKIFESCGNLPIYVAYRRSEGITEGELESLFLNAQKCGADLIEIPGNMFDRLGSGKLSIRPLDVHRQILLVNRIRMLGSEAMISVCVGGMPTALEYEMYASDVLTRNVGAVAIINKDVGTVELSELEYIADRIREMTEKKFLLEFGLRDDSGKMNALSMGSCMYKCVQSHGDCDDPSMPLLSEIRAICGRK